MRNSNRVSILLLFIISSVFSVQAATVEVINIPSKKMIKKIPVTLILPDSYTNSIQRFPVTYLLHGAGDDYKRWSSATEVAKLSDEYGVIFVCPDGDRTSWYFDSPINPESQYETFIAKECVEYIDKNYRTKANRNYRAICGASMGGHGALFLSIRNQDTFSIAVSLSGGVDIRPYAGRWGIQQRLGNIKTHKDIFEKYTVINLAKKLKDNDLAISIDCGDKDFFIKVNRALHKQLEEDGISHEYIEMPGGHGWVYWKVAIKRQMPFIDQQFKK